MTAEELLAGGQAALEEGRWADARSALEASLAAGESAEARFGLAVALWWLGENRASVAECSHAYPLYRRLSDVAGAVQCAIWLAITYKANFSNFAAANGWLGRADRLLEPIDPGPLHAWVWLARAYRMPDLEVGEELTGRAVDLARAQGDSDLELVALSQLGLIRVGRGDVEGGFALIDEVMAVVLAGERSRFDTVVYACCDMLNACELASDVERAARWCEVADDFVQTYGCPFLYAECRILYGSVLSAKGRWEDADRELATGLQITEGVCPGLHARALTRLAGLRIRQGRLEDAERLLSEVGEDVDAQQEIALSVAALLLAKGDAPAASRSLEQRLDHLEAHRSHLAALDLLVDAYLAAGDLDAAHAAAERAAELASQAESEGLVALVGAARGRVALARGDTAAAADHLEAALTRWSHADLPFEAARTRFELGRVLAASRPDVAIDHFRRSLAAFESLGAAIDADRVAAFLRSLGVTPRVGPKGPKGVGVLTAREREVLQLLGLGLSNPEIAARLHVSRKTASHHVSSILTKLNLRNRTEAATYAMAAK